ncbi:MAG: lipoyl protein ligase domain-containing protein [Candidatus Binataceae bacterium]
MAVLDAIVLPAFAPLEIAGLEIHLLEAVAAQRIAPTLIVYASPEKTVSLGRYHLYSGAAQRAGIGAARRLTGGRAIGAGDGWLSIALIVPRVGALLSERDAALKPDQVMNRYVRGLLAALRSLGVDCFYPGRDAITSDHRELAACSFEVAASGAMLFEAALAVNRGMEELIHDLDRLDPAGGVSCPMYGPENATNLARILGRDIGFAEIARAIIAGYGGLADSVCERTLEPEERAHATRRAEGLTAGRWLRLAANPQSFNRSNRIAAQLGAVEVRLDVADNFTIERLMLTGDFVANSPGVAELEHRLAGATLDLPSVTRAVIDTYGGGRNFILGLGALDNLIQLIAEAA